METGNIADALVDVISRVNFPKEIVSDIGYHFTSDLIKELCWLISLKQLFTIHYTPNCNVLCEQINGFLKSTLKICARRNKLTVTDIYLQFCLHTKKVQQHQHDSHHLNVCMGEQFVDLCRF